MRRRSRRRLARLFPLVLLAACAPPTPDSGAVPDSLVGDSSHAPAGGPVPAAEARATIEAVGVVRFVDLEGGCWAIDVEGDRLQPANLAEDFRVDSLRVRFKAHPVDAMSFCMLGPIVEIESIDRVDD